MVNNLAALHSQYAKNDTTHALWMMKEAKNGYTRAVEGFEQAFGPEHKYYLTALSNQAILMFQEVKMMADTIPEEHRGTAGSVATGNPSTSANGTEDDDGRSTCNDFFEVVAYP